MGCDIHAFVEIKNKGKWYLYDQPDIDRSYELFGKMAGVRDESQTPIVEPKGLPTDLSDITKLELDYWDGDGHTHSWFNREEIKLLKEWYGEDVYQFWKQWGFPIVNQEDGEGREFIEDTRLIFWFDN